MKTLICLVLCALVATAYSAPAPERAEIEALLRSLQQQAEIEGWFSKLKNIAKKVAPYAKKGYEIYKDVNGGARVQQDDDDDDDIAQIEAIIANMQKQAEIEGIFSSLKKIGKKALPYVKKGYNIYRSANGGVEMQFDDDDDDDDDDNTAAIEAFVKSLQDEANQQSFWSTAGKIGLSLLGKKK